MSPRSPPPPAPLDNGRPGFVIFIYTPSRAVIYTTLYFFLSIYQRRFLFHRKIHPKIKLHPPPPPLSPIFSFRGLLEVPSSSANRPKKIWRETDVTLTSPTLYSILIGIKWGAIFFKIAARHRRCCPQNQKPKPKSNPNCDPLLQFLILILILLFISISLLSLYPIPHLPPVLPPLFLSLSFFKIKMG